MKLAELLKAARVATPFETDIDIRGIVSDSREVEDGYLFVALPGTNNDGSKYVSDAIARGAVAILTQEPIEATVPVLQTSRIREALSRMCVLFYEPHPGTLVGVTGTNGKTSTVFFTRQIFEHAGLLAASMGTLGVQSKNFHSYSGMTTTDSVRLNQDLQALAENGITHVAMEASSHGLEQHRLDGLMFKASAFTNLTRDHLDYHLTMEAYLEAKLKLFTHLTSEVAVLNADVPEFEAIKSVCAAKGLRIFSYGKNGEEIRLMSQLLHETGQELTIELFGHVYTANIPVAGHFQGMNILAALGLAIAVGVDIEKAVEALGTLKSPDGRMELVGRTQKGASIFVDYAHTPDGLETALKSLRLHTQGKLYVVFGCGGNRDTGKRPMMGKIASELADTVIVTDDNPRFEDASLIRSQILAAAPNAIEIADRAKAIFYAVSHLEEGDVLLLAGKGHEEGQLINGFMHPFNDKIQAILSLRTLEEKPLWTSDELTEATSGKAYKTFVGYGVSIDTRTLIPGDIFIALHGERLDGHDYVAEALKKGAAAAVVSHDIPDVPDSAKLFFVVNTDEALQDMARYALRHSRALKIGITGSSGKTTTKEMLALALKGQGTIHATQGNFNNQWGVPLTLARLPRLADYAIIEMGMNHTGEMEYLSHLVEPDIAMITMIGSAHHEFFKTLQDIAAAKAEIFIHMNKQGTVVLPRDSAYYEFLQAKAMENGVEHQLSFGQNLDADVRLLKAEQTPDGTSVSASLAGELITFSLQTMGEHFVMNALGVLAMVKALGADVKKACQNLSRMKPLKGRGAQIQTIIDGKLITLIDDSYNANPSSMKAAISVLAQKEGRKLAVLGDMLELGEQSRPLHTALADDLTTGGIDRLYTVGREMRALFETVPPEMRGWAAQTALELLPILKQDLRNGDVVLLKGSNGTKIGRLVEALQN